VKTAEIRLKSHGLRITESRRSIVEIFCSHEHALSYSDILDDLDEGFDRVTLYRTIKTFEENGLIHVIPDTEGDPKYALCSSNCSSEQHNDSHMHFKCKVCNITWCIEDQEVPRVNLPDGFNLETVNLIVEGRCKKCSA